MANYATLSNGIVTNVYVANSPLNEGDVLTTTAGPGWSYSGGIFTAPAVAAPTSAQLYAILVASAAIALDYSNAVAIQCFKSSVAYPSAWQTYDTSLQNIINGTDTTSTVLPSLPTLPTGLPSSFPSSAQLGSLAG